MEKVERANFNNENRTLHQQCKTNYNSRKQNDKWDKLKICLTGKSKVMKPLMPKIYYQATYIKLT